MAGITSLFLVVIALAALAGVAGSAGQGKRHAGVGQQRCLAKDRLVILHVGDDHLELSELFETKEIGAEGVDQETLDQTIPDRTTPGRTMPGDVPYYEPDLPDAPEPNDGVDHGVPLDDLLFRLSANCSKCETPAWFPWAWDDWVEEGDKVNVRQKDVDAIQRASGMNSIVIYCYLSSSSHSDDFVKIQFEDPVPDSTADVPDSAPDVPDSAPDVPDSAPDVPDSGEDVPDSTESNDDDDPPDGTETLPSSSPSSTWSHGTPTPGDSIVLENVGVIAGAVGSAAVAVFVGGGVFILCMFRRSQHASTDATDLAPFPATMPSNRFADDEPTSLFGSGSGGVGGGGGGSGTFGSAFSSYSDDGIGRLYRSGSGGVPGGVIDGDVDQCMDQWAIEDKALPRGEMMLPSPESSSPMVISGMTTGFPYVMSSDLFERAPFPQREWVAAFGEQDPGLHPDVYDRWAGLLIAEDLFRPGDLAILDGDALQRMLVKFPARLSSNISRLAAMFRGGILLASPSGSMVAMRKGSSGGSGGGATRKGSSGGSGGGDIGGSGNHSGDSKRKSRASSHNTPPPTPAAPGTPVIVRNGSRTKPAAAAASSLADSARTDADPVDPLPMAGGNRKRLFQTATEASRKRPHQCPQCHKAFNRPSKLKEHLASHHGDDPKPFACDYPSCNKRYPRRDHLSRHMKSHNK